MSSDSPVPPSAQPPVAHTSRVDRSDREIAVRVVLEEFKALKREIEKRINLQFQLVFFNFSVVAGDAALVFQLHADVLFLLLLPLLSLMLGLLWLDALGFVVRIGIYIRSRQWEYLRVQLGAPDLPSWEDAWIIGQFRRTTSFLAIVPPFGVFVAPVIPSLVVVLIEMSKSPATWTLWILTVAVSVAGIVAAAFIAFSYGESAMESISARS